MLKINGTDICLTRGDTAYLQVTIATDIGGTQTAYEIKEADVLRLTLKKSAYEPEAVLQKTVIGEDTFHILPEDTKNLKFGSYVYDVELTTAEGDVFTIISPSKFEILWEVTW